MDILTAGIEESILKKINVIEVMSKSIRSKIDSSQSAISKISDDFNSMSETGLDDIQNTLISTVGEASAKAAIISSELQEASDIIDMSSGGCLGAVGSFLKGLSSDAAMISNSIMDAITLPPILGLGDFVNIGSIISNLVSSSGIVVMISKLEDLIATMPCLNPSFKVEVQNRLDIVKSDLFIGQDGFDDSMFNTQMMSDLYASMTNVPEILKENITGSLKDVQDTAASSIAGAKDQAIAMKTKMSDTVASNIPKLKLPTNYI